MHIHTNPAARRAQWESITSEQRRAINAPIIAEHHAARVQVRAADAAWLTFARKPNDEFPLRLSSWPQRAGQRAAAEAEWDALGKQMIAANGDDDLTVEQETEFEIAFDDWHEKYDYLFTPAPKEPEMSVNLPTVPGPANALSLFDLDTATAWASRDRFGNPASGDWANAAVILRRLKLEVRFNAWIERTEIRDIGEAWEPLQDHHVTKILRVGSSAPHDYRPAKSILWDAIESLARDNNVDPALDLLDQLESAYDGTPRLNCWLSHTCGVDADQYHTDIGTAILLGLVARIRRPGCKFDFMPVFVSEMQGTSKSTMVRILSLNDDWFIEDIALGESSKELVLLLAGKSVVEISEMKTRGEPNAVKAMVSRQTDTGRPAYGHSVVTRPRRNIFIGTTNDREFLEDLTGGRRFWPINVVGEIDLDWLRANIGQLIGEAAYLQSNGHETGLRRETWALAGEHQEAARIASGTEELLRDWYDVRESDVYVPTAEIVKRLSDFGQATNSKAIAPTMKRLGYQRDKVRDMPRIWVKSATGRYHPGCQCITVAKLVSGPTPALPAPRA